MDDDDGLDGELLSWVHRLEASDTVSLGDSIHVRIVGTAGSNLCYELARIDKYVVRGGWILRPIVLHDEPAGTGCADAPSTYDETLTLPTNMRGTFWIRVVAYGPDLTDSVRVQ
jgi:hypothetical protein